MQTTTLKSSEVAPNPRVVRILRSPARNRSQGRRVVPSAAVHKPPSKWTVVAAFILAVVLHAGPVLWVELYRETSQLEVSAPGVTHSVEEAIFDANAGTGNANAAGGRTGAD
jgi:hypothetical protein